MPGSSGDEPDFGFLNEQPPQPDTADQFQFGAEQPAPTSPGNAKEQPASPNPEQGNARKKVRRSRPSSKSDGSEKQIPKQARKQSSSTADRSAVKEPTESQREAAEDSVPKAHFLGLAIYAAIVSVSLLLQMLGVFQLGGSHQLESLPDVAPLKPGEFQAVPESASVAPGHELKLGQEAQYGNVVFTPVKVVREPLMFEHMSTGSVDESQTSEEVLKLYFTVRNVDDEFAFPPWDLSLMTHRSPPQGIDESTKANTWLKVQQGGSQQRVLNYFHSPVSSFNVQGIVGRVPLQPNETRTTFVASATGIDEWMANANSFRWRLQLRKGMNPETKNSVTTLIDVTFNASEIQG